MFADKCSFLCDAQIYSTSGGLQECQAGIQIEFLVVLTKLG